MIIPIIRYTKIAKLHINALLARPCSRSTTQSIHCRNAFLIERGRLNMEACDSNKLGPRQLRPHLAAYGAKYKTNYGHNMSK